jgi:hypothetical protein
VKIAEDQRLMQGVGRVVWKREPPDTSSDRPAGMGVKFIKIDEQSKKLIDQLVSSRGEGTAAFEQGEAPASATPSIPAAAFQEKLPEPEPSGRPVTMRKATMIGLGAMGQGGESEPAPAVGRDESFFPKGDDKPMPAPEDRTVMKQAAELLEDALREAGGSMEEVGDTGAPAATSTRPTEELSTPAVPDTHAREERSAAAALRDSPVPVVKDEPRVERVAAAVEPRGSVHPEPQRSRSEPARDLRASERARRPSVSPLEESTSGGGGKIIALLLGVAAAAALVFFLTRQKPAEPAAEPVAPVDPVAQEPAAAPGTEPTAIAPSAAPVADAAEATQLTADAGTPAADAGAAAAEPPLEKPAPKPKPEVKVRPAPKPKPKVVAPVPEPAAVDEPEPEPKPEPKPKAEPAPKADPKPKPAPAEESDNPY